MVVQPFPVVWSRLHYFSGKNWWVNPSLWFPTSLWALLNGSL